MKIDHRIKKSTGFIIGSILVVALSAGTVYAGVAGYTTNQGIFSSGGTLSSSTSYQVSGVIGGSVAGWSSSRIYTAGGGYGLPDSYTSQSPSSSSPSGTGVPKKSLYDTSTGNTQKPANIRTINVWAHTRTVLAGDQVTIYANMANRGDIESVYTATLKINGVVEETKTGMLQGNTAVPLEFVVCRDEPGNYIIDLNGKTTYFSVIAEESRDPIASIFTRNTALITGSVLIYTLILLLIILVFQRRKRHFN
jgi:hypothetical protein